MAEQHIDEGSDEKHEAEEAPLGEIIAHPDAVYWARECRWVPGSGYCRKDPCEEACAFRRQREIEAARIARSRRQRRRAPYANFANAVRRALRFAVPLAIFGLVRFRNSPLRDRARDVPPSERCNSR